MLQSTSAIVKRKLSNAGDTVWNRDAGQITTMPKRMFPNAGNTIFNYRFLTPKFLYAGLGLSSLSS